MVLTGEVGVLQMRRSYHVGGGAGEEVPRKGRHERGDGLLWVRGCKCARGQQAQEVHKVGVWGAPNRCILRLYREQCGRLTRVCAARLPQDCKSKLEKLKRDQAALRNHSYNPTSCPVCLEDFEDANGSGSGAGGSGADGKAGRMWGGAGRGRTATCEGGGHGPGARP